MEIGVMGPIGESGSLMLRINRNCPWNRCAFCPVYKRLRFSPRSAEEIRADIDCAAQVWGLLDDASWSMGLGGRITDAVLRNVVRDRPDIYGTGGVDVTPGQLCALNTLRNVAVWVRHGACRVFLQDADALAMNPDDLADILTHLKLRFPATETITAYSRSKTCARRSPDDLRALHDCGLTLCLTGVESGSDAVLAFMDKGVAACEHVDALCRLREAGIRAAAFVMPGLGGRNKGHEAHMEETVRVLNAGRPSEVRVRSLAVVGGSPLMDLVRSCRFLPPTEEQMIGEIGQLIEGINYECDLETLQMTNTLFSFKGSIAQARESLLPAIGAFTALPGHQQAQVLLERCVTGGYVDCVRSWGLYDESIGQAIHAAEASIQKGDADALEKTNRALRLIKSKGIP